jgi:hypothetical protein
MRFITLSVVLGVVLGLVGRTDSFSLPGLKVQIFRNFALRVSTDPSIATGSACKLPVIDDPTSQSERATKGSNTTGPYLPILQPLQDHPLVPYYVLPDNSNKPDEITNSTRGRGIERSFHRTSSRRH